MSKTRTATAVALTLVAPLVLLPSSADAIDRHRARPSVQVIHEDDPRWDCRTMGNRTCGVTTNGVTYLVTHDRMGMPYIVTVKAG